MCYFILNLRAILPSISLSVVFCPVPPQSHLGHYPSRVIKRENITSDTPPHPSYGSASLSMMDGGLSHQPEQQRGAGPAITHL